ncbi:hypothetical protein QYE76_016523 [Lolium multiflorum]|uniref:CCHC-type domain-containing protein n=1 Tax=Lolium multiflorum TaxID=4521 RepID=A0AAD8VG17_LOLMU|nr:hypothetical protein QYE76_016523 [Lolium multiflorum]
MLVLQPESENSYDIDNVSAVLDDSGSLGSFLDATIARTRQIENTETPDATSPVNSPELDYSCDDPDEDYVELNDDLINRCNATADARAVIDCNKEKVTFNVDDREHTVYFPKRIEKACGVNTISNKRGMDNFNFGEVFQGETTSTGRPSRSSTRFRQSYNEDLIAPSFAPEEDNGVPNASSFPCYDFLRNAGLLEDFLTLVGKAGLTTYVGDESEQYYTLTKIFVESFKFNNKHFHPAVSFKIYGKPITMKLENFCAALGIVPVGTARKIEDNPRELLELYRGITNDDCRTIQRGKIRNIQLPAIKYFAYYIGTSILGRENTSNISSYHLGFLIAALTGDTPYHLGALVARRLSSKGPIFGGIIASRVLAYLELPLDPNDVKIAPMRLDIAAMKSHQFVTTDSSLDKIIYRILFADGEEREILLPQPDLFSIDREPWSRTKEEVDEQLKIQGFHQQHDSEDAELTTTPSRIRVLLLAHTRNMIHLRTTKVLLHGHHGIDLHLGKSLSLGEMAPPTRSANQDAMMQMLQTMLEDRQAERAERQANIAALQQLANNNQGHHDHPGSKLKNFQNTNPPIFNKTEEPLDADDWLQTMENNLEVAGVEAAEKVLFATHYLAGPARAWWTSTRAMNAGQMMTWEDFKLKFSKYHVPQGLIKKMRDEFRELKQGRMSVVEYRDYFTVKTHHLDGRKTHQANENRKRRMMNRMGPKRQVPQQLNGGFASKYNQPPAQIYRPSNNNNRNTNNNRNSNNNNNNNNNQNNGNRTNNNNHTNGNNNHPNTAPVTGSNAVPVNPKDKSTVNCYECGVVGHYSNECPKKLAKIAINTAAPAQQQRRRRNQNNNNGRFYHMTANEAQEAPQAMPCSPVNLTDQSFLGT